MEYFHGSIQAVASTLVFTHLSTGGEQFYVLVVGITFFSPGMRQTQHNQTVCTTHGVYYFETYQSKEHRHVIGIGKSTPPPRSPDKYY